MWVTWFFEHVKAYLVILAWSMEFQAVLNFVMKLYIFGEYCQCEQKVCVLGFLHLEMYWFIL